ncbi:MAG: hypothetical protein ACO3FT_08060 [Ilumatobacteraceae bacterium]
MTIQATGLKEALRDLNKLEPSLRKEIGRDIRRIVKPVADTINTRIPGGPPLSGMAHNGRTGWGNRKAVAIKLDTRKPRNRPGRPFHSIVSVVRVGTKDAPTAIADMAGKAGGGTSRRSPQYRRPNFARALTSRLGPASRFMWRDIDQQLEAVQDELQPVIRRVEDAVNRDLKVKF